MSIVFKDFGTAYLAAPLAVGGLTITVDNPAALPILTNSDYFYLVLQKYGDRSYVEIVKVTATAGSTYTIQRGQAGTSIRAFAVGDYAELRLTVDGLTEYISQNIATKMDKSGGGDFSGLYRFLNPNISRIDVVRTSDSVAASLVVDFSASEGHRTIVGGTIGSNVTTPSILLRPNGYGNGTGQVKIDSNGLVDVVGLNVRGQQGTDEGSVVRYGYLSNYVPTTRKVNGHALSADFSITADEVFSAGATVNQRAVFQASDLQYKQADGAYGLRLAVSAAIAYLQGGKTDGALDDQKLYLSGWLGNPLSAFKVYADAVLIHRKSGVDYKIFDEYNKPVIGDVVGLSDALAQAGGNPVLSTAWVQLRSAMWNGYVAADGQLLKRADYPDAWAAIEAGKVPVTVNDADWLNNPNFRGCFSPGDGSTTFRVPDYNGKYLGSMGAVFLRGDGLNSAGVAGHVQGDAIRNIKGRFASAIMADIYGFVLPARIASERGAFGDSFVADGVDTSINITTGAQNVAAKALTFDASRTVPTAADNRPVNVTGCWAVKLFGAVQNVGSIDAASLATQLAAAQSKISALEAANDKHYFYGSGFVAVAIGADSAALPVVSSVKASYGITQHPSKQGVTVNKKGRYRVSYSYDLEPMGYVQNTILTVYTGKSSNVVGATVAYRYSPASSVAAVMVPLVYTDVFSLEAGDDVYFRVNTVNGTSAKIHTTGHFQVEEV